MWIKFLRPVPGMSYFENDIADIEEEEADRLIKKGYASISDKKKIESDLPDLLPGRIQLLKNGLYTKQQVLSAKETLHDVPGIGSKTAAAIIDYLS